MADATDLKSVGELPLAGSSPAPGTCIPHAAEFHAGTVAGKGMLVAIPLGIGTSRRREIVNQKTGWFHSASLFPLCAHFLWRKL